VLVSIHHPHLTTVKIVAEKVVSVGRVLFLFFYLGGKKRREKRKVTNAKLVISMNIPAQ